MYINWQTSINKIFVYWSRQPFTSFLGVCCSGLGLCWTSWSSGAELNRKWTAISYKPQEEPFRTTPMWYYGCFDLFDFVETQFESTFRQQASYCQKNATDLDQLWLDLEDCSCYFLFVQQFPVMQIISRDISLSKMCSCITWSLVFYDFLFVCFLLVSFIGNHRLPDSSGLVLSA